MDNITIKYYCIYSFITSKLTSAPPV